MADVGRQWSRSVLVAGTAPALGALLSACALSFPMSGFVDKAPTGSIARPAATLSPALTKEDLRRANAALAVALDPRRGGSSVGWDNPGSGAKGSFVALAPAVPEHDRICRSFRGRLAILAKAERRFEGSACRDLEGEWGLVEVVDRP